MHDNHHDDEAVLMRGDLEAAVERLRCEQIDDHLDVLRAAVAQARLELGGHHLAYGEREPLLRAILQIEVEICRLEQLRLRPSRRSSPVFIPLYDGPAPE